MVDDVPEGEHMPDRRFLVCRVPPQVLNDCRVRRQLLEILRAAAGLFSVQTIMFSWHVPPMTTTKFCGQKIGNTHP